MHRAGDDQRHPVDNPALRLIDLTVLIPYSCDQTCRQSCRNRIWSDALFGDPQALAILRLRRRETYLTLLGKSLKTAPVDRGKCVPAILFDRIWNPWRGVELLEVSRFHVAITNDIRGDVRSPRIGRVIHAVLRQRQRAFSVIHKPDGEGAYRPAFR